MSGREPRLLSGLVLAALGAIQAAVAAPDPAQAASGPGGTPVGVHHVLEVALDPKARTLEVTDTITFPGGAPAEFEFLLNGRLALRDDAKEVPLGDVAPFFGINSPPDSLRDTPLKRYRAQVGKGAASLRLRYGGVFDFPLSDPKEEYTRGFRETIGMVSPDGVYLTGSGFWYPHAGQGLLTFEMSVTLPPGWHAVSQGKGTGRAEDGMARWDSEGPMDEIFLVGGPLVTYQQAAGRVSTEVYLRQKDDALAGKYIAATAQYLKMYADLIGPYPYGKFAMVENFWETGYGMPSFTLLGPQIIRFPFILTSSYPHEILHNWWGNSVFVDYARGNWCEGLTAYMADHLIQEQRGKGEDNRRSALQRYRDYVQTGRDFPLREFRSRHSAATEAVGYGRTMMGFHMLRRAVGDDAFRQWASRFYKLHRGRQASFDDVKSSMEEVSGNKLDRFFTDWVERTGAPTLSVEVTSMGPADGGQDVKGVLRQTQAEDAFALDVPVALQTDTDTVIQVVRMEGREAAFTIRSAGRPLALHVDPSFDLFRRLDPRETPPSIGQIFGEPRILAVIPSSAPEAEQKAWRALAEGWRSDSHDPEVRTDAEVVSLPPDRSVWLLGAANRLAVSLALPEGEAAVDEASIKARGETMPRPGHSFVLVARHPADPAHAVGWIAADPLDALPGLGRKLPHYGRYSYLGFEGSEPVNVLKGDWSASDSPLRLDLRPESSAIAGPAGRSGRDEAMPALKLPARAALAQLPTVFSADALRDHVAWLASAERQGRGLGTPGLEAAADYVARQFQAIGLKPGGDNGTYLQRFTTTATADGAPRELANVIGVLAGSRPEAAAQSVVVGAHYDHLGLGWPDPHEGNVGKVHPGADDNASGVAILIELARALAAGEKPARTVVFAAFTAEEAGRLGSKHYVEHPFAPIEQTRAMINLDTVGRLGSGRLSVLATGTASEWQHIARGVSYVVGVDSRLIPESYDASDQKSFIDRGVPAVQLFTEPHGDYHRPGDTPDKIDVAGMVKVAAFAHETLTYLAERAEPLTVTIAAQAGSAGGEGRSGGAGPASGAAGERRVSLGTVPDFGFSGPGVRVSSVVAGSPAQAAGILEGDILVKLAGQAVASLKSYSDLLKTLSPGQAVEVTVMRDGAPVTLTATLVAR